MSVTELFIIRHGIAEDHNPEDPSDHGRRLTEQGQMRVAAAAKGMHALGISPDVIWTSPHVRALQTAELVAAELRPTGGVQVQESLSFSGGSAAIRSEMVSAAGSLMVVGHEPVLSDLASELCAHGRLRLHLKKCSLVHLSLYDLPHGQTGELECYLTPRALRRVGACTGTTDNPSETS